MNEQRIEKKVRQDAAKFKKDASKFVGDSSVQFSRFEDDVSEATGKARDDITLWVEDGVSQLSEGFEKLTGDARETMAGAAATMKKDINDGLSQYNAKAQEIADKVPGGFSEMAARYPWVTISIALAVGFMLGGLMKPARLRHG